MSNKRTIDAFRVSAEQVAFSGQRKGITAPNVQAAVEEIKEKLDEVDHSHQGEGENSIQLGPDANAHADSSIAIGHDVFTNNETRYNAPRSVALGAGSQAAGESAIAIGDSTHAFGYNAIAIGKWAVTQDRGEGEIINDPIAIGTSTFADNQSVAIGSGALATHSHTIAIGAEWCQANDEHAIAIGTQAQAYMPNTISIGRGSQAFVDNAIAIGPYAKSSNESGIALGNNAQVYAEGAISIGKNTMNWGKDNIAIGNGAEAYYERSVAIGPGAIAQEAYTIVLGTADHTVIIPGELKVLGGIKTNISWFAPSDNVIAEMSTPLQASQDDAEIGIDEKSLTIRNPGRYRIKGYINAGDNAWARFEILERDEAIVETVFVNESAQAFSLDFKRDIGINTTLTFRLEVGKIVPSSILPVTATVSEIRVCGTETDIGNGVIGW